MNMDLTLHRIGFAGSDRQYVESFHETVAVPFTRTVRSNIDTRLGMAYVLSGFAVADSRTRAVYKEDGTADVSAVMGLLKSLLRHYNDPTLLERNVDGVLYV
eukprot:TRINITY_DN2957_c0_g1_i13.p3 TRINITY_DN2957_c0_g1~~TRINITY_DN2957_c0_g1_i13.p3  ORF type:complete len:102 (-),score=37.83 TRINITY_DN2957_c0_g1_i13:416-721(-)